MDDFISREAAIAAAFSATSLGNSAFRDVYDTVSRLRLIPAADVRPVVLCRDCIHCKKGKVSLECEKHKYAWNSLNRRVNEDDFCSWGVKKEKS